jgi:hypothetical protein
MKEIFSAYTIFATIQLLLKKLKKPRRAFKGIGATRRQNVAI